MLRYTERSLLSDDRPSRVYDYYVSGKGVFPVDMLRHDRCWPADGDSVAMFDIRDKRSIRLKSYQMPAEGRWLSFGWSVGRDKLYIV